MTFGRRAAIIFNPVHARFARLQKLVTAVEADEGWDATLWLETTADSDPAELVATAIDGGASLVIAAGGDGTVRSVGAAMRAHDVPFAVLPTGTANLLARNLELPLLDLAQAVRIAFAGDDRRIDVGTLDYIAADGTAHDLPFLVMTGFGIDADMVAGADPEMKRRFGWLAYVGPIVWAMRPRQGVGVKYSIDGASARASRVHTLFIGNCGTITAGIRLLPEAVMDDGLLDVLAIRSVPHWLRRHSVDEAQRYRWRAPTTSRPARGFRYGTATSLDVTLDPPAEFQADGDALGLVRWARASVDRQAITVRVPRILAG